MFSLVMFMIYKSSLVLFGWR